MTKDQWHIGLGEFYKKVNDDVYFYREQNYIFGYEGIFDIGNKEMYKDEKIDYTKKYIEQPIMLGGLHPSDVNLDLNWFEIIAKVEGKMDTENKLNSENRFYKKQVLTDLPLLKNQIAMNATDLDPVVYTENNVYRLRYFENLKNEYGLDIASMYYGSHKIEDSIIIEERNQLVANFITKSNNERILIHYGSEHFQGIFTLLKQNDPNWKIVRVEKLDVL